MELDKITTTVGEESEGKFKVPDVPKTTVGEFNLPCGYVNEETGELYTKVVISELGGEDEDIFFSNMQSASIVNNVLFNRVESIGPITNKDQIKQIVPQLTIGDRVFLMIALRRVSEGDIFMWESKCPTCGDKSMHRFDLKDLEIEKMPEPKKRIYDYELPRMKQTARWAVMNGLMESKRDKLRKKHHKDKATLPIFLRLLSLDDKPVSMDIVKSLPMHDRNRLRHQFDKFEGGVETDIDLECPSCGVEFKDELNIADKNFFFPDEIPGA